MGTTDEGQSVEDSQAGPGNEGNEVWERQQRFTQTAGQHTDGQIETYTDQAWSPEA